ncbi:MAG TPA: hypothetical protein VFK65_03335, partial [Candidatus Binatia bacterium]|nr:hypothetical protein [Candidatus Binatia bacterium]
MKPLILFQATAACRPKTPQAIANPDDKQQLTREAQTCRLPICRLHESFCRTRKDKNQSLMSTMFVNIMLITSM